MKLKKRFLALVLAMIMVMCMSVTAFAENTNGVSTIQIVVDGQSEVYQVSSGQTVKGALDYLASIGEIESPSWTVVADWYNATITHYALIGIGEDNVSMAGAAKDLAGTVFSNVQESDAVSGHPGYYLVGQNGNTYHYVYVGYDWTYTSTAVNGGNIYTYMCCYTLTAGETVTITYGKQVSDWTQTSAL